jgi:hypothetical protein
VQGKHQLIYSTHSPFMVGSTHFDRVRIVQGLSIVKTISHEKGSKCVATNVCYCSYLGLHLLNLSFAAVGVTTVT